MVLDPIVLQIPLPTPPPESRFSKILRFLHIPHFGARSTKIITAISAIVIALTMITMVGFSLLSNNKKFTQDHGLTVNQQAPQTTGSTKSNIALPGGGTATGVGGTTGTNSPVITLTADPASVPLGGTATLKWSVTNNPSSCTASDDWSGTKPANGSEVTLALSKVQTYLFTLTCKTATGTGFSTVSVQAIEQGGTGAVATRPSVTLAAAPSAIYTGDSSTLNWSVTNGPNSCTASGDWSGNQPTSGSQSTGTLTTAKSYSYTLTCTNSAGSGYATATVLVTNPPPGFPIVSISSNPSHPVTPGSSVTLTWSTTNSPTSCTASGDWSGSKPASGTQSTGPLNTIKSYTYSITCSNSTGSSFDAAAVGVVPNPPAVTLTVSPSSITIGNSATISWSATNSPTSCTASGDWTGAQAASGSVSTGVLNTAKTYLYSLTCKNAGGSGFVNNVALTVSIPPVPVVTITANPIAITSGGSSNLTWSATNSPSSCTASGDWSGAKAVSGTASTGVLNTVKTYSYTLSCTNAGGTGSATTTVGVSASGGGVVAPVVSISLSPTSIGTGSSSTITWSATNSPTSCTASGSWSGSKSGSGSANTGAMASAGSFTYTLSCSNSAGSNSASATLTVIAIPVVTISVSPASINTGASATITWSVTNSPSSCTAGGSWTGTKAASGSQTTGAMSSVGSFAYSLSCTNSGGTASNSATLTVAAAGKVYCAGLGTTKLPCYGPNDLAGHNLASDCWAWNLNWVIDITSFRPAHPGGISGGSSSTIASPTDVCNHDISGILSGSQAISGYSDVNGHSTHGHSSGTINNSTSGKSVSGLVNFQVGFYDATKP